jgi:molybdopterin-guanine dinucleotide biosynthesis protein B
MEDGVKAFGITGASGSGKTTLIAALLPMLCGRGLTVSTIKHAHHGFDLDQPGKDSWLHRAAGAQEVMLASGDRWALLRNARSASDCTLETLLARMTPVDLVLVEGFRADPIPKLEVCRQAVGKPPFWPSDPGITAVATDAPDCATTRPLFVLSDHDAIADLILAECGL